MKEEKQTLMEMFIGLFVATLLVVVIGVFIANNKSSYILGVLLGSVVALVVLYQMYHTLGKAVEMEGKRATRYTVASALVRMALMGASLAIGILWPDVFNIVGILLGLLTLKLCAFVQPIIHKTLSLKKI